MIYIKVVKIDKKTSKYGPRGYLDSIKCSEPNYIQTRTSSGDKLKKKRKMKLSNNRSVMYKGIAYPCSQLMTWSFLITVIAFGLADLNKEPVIIGYLLDVYMPLQGVHASPKCVQLGKLLAS